MASAILSGRLIAYSVCVRVHVRVRFVFVFASCSCSPRVRVRLGFMFASCSCSCLLRTRLTSPLIRHDSRSLSSEPERLSIAFIFCLVSKNQRALLRTLFWSPSCGYWVPYPPCFNASKSGSLTYLWHPPASDDGGSTIVTSSSTSSMRATLRRLMWLFIGILSLRPKPTKSQHIQVTLRLPLPHLECLHHLLSASSLSRAVIVRLWTRLTTGLYPSTPTISMR